jgi:hypothetical protein
MARILHLDNKADRHNIIRDALKDHCVYSVHSFEDAQKTLQAGPYLDLALVAMTSKSGPDHAAGQLLEFLRAWYPSIYRVVVTEWSLPPGETARMFDRYPVDEIIDCEGRNAQQISRALKNALDAKQRRIPQQIKIYRSELRQEIMTSWRISGAEIRDHINGLEEYVTATSRVPGQAHRAEQEVKRSRLMLRDLDLAFERLEEAVDQIITPQKVTLLREDLRRAEMMFADERALWVGRT